MLTPVVAVSRPVGVITDDRVTPAPGIGLDLRIPGGGIDTFRPIEPRPTLLDQASPVMLMPMRLEFRLVEKAEDLSLARSKPDYEGTNLKKNSALDFSKVKFPKSQRSRNSQTKQLWFRWFPDDSFACSGIEEIRDEEIKAKENFESLIGDKKWHDVEDEGVSAAWQSFARNVGATRAVHLMRNKNSDVSGDLDKNWGRIIGCPTRVVLYAISSSGEVSPLADGAEILPENFAYTQGQLNRDTWVSDFGFAVEQGMGLKILDDNTIDKALGADWVVAIGLHSKDGVEDVETLLKDSIANGNLEILSQGTPTNSSPNERSPYTALDRDTIATLKKAAGEERGKKPSVDDRGTFLLAQALGVDEAILVKSIGMDNTDQADLKAMVTLLLPALIKSGFALANAFSAALGQAGKFDDEAVIDFFVNYIRARGVLPSIRLKRNPYGILPVARLDEIGGVDDASPFVNDKHGFETVLDFTSSIIKKLQGDTSKLTVLKPDDPQAQEKLDEILSNHAISTTLDLGDRKNDKTEKIGCPYVSGSSDEHKVSAYLKSFQVAVMNRNMGRMSDPDQFDLSYPLLYRLIRLGMTAYFPDTDLPFVKLDPTWERSAYATLTSRGGRAVSRLGHPVTLDLDAIRGTETGIGSSMGSEIQRDQGRMRDALAHLATATERLGDAGLETLMFEVLDTLQYRADAWHTGLSYFRLLEHRARYSNKNLNIGYYGMLNDLNSKIKTGATSRYLQAPGMDQSETLAILYSAYQRFRSKGAFDINLSSKRCRRGLKLIELIKNGLTQGEALGHRGERWLHDNKQDSLKFLLREAYPFTNTDDAGQTLEVQLFDGTAFLNDSNRNKLNSNKSKFVEVQNILKDDLDAFSDIIMCEAVHLLTHNNHAGANAWVRVLSGGAIPSRLTFIRTQRQGQASTHRVSLVLNKKSMGTSLSVREITEPFLASMADRTLGNVGALKICVTITSSDDPEKTKDFKVSLSRLGIKPIDIVIGGSGELEVRCRAHVINLWRTDATLATTFGDLLGQGTIGYINANFPTKLDFGSGSGSISSVLNRAAEIRAVVIKARPLEPADLNAATLLEYTLDSDAMIETCSPARLDLRARASQVKSLAQDAKIDLENAFLAVQAQLSVIETAANEVAFANALTTLNNLRSTLDQALKEAANFAIPEALRPYSNTELIQSIENIEVMVNLVTSRLQNKINTLIAGLNDTQSNPSTGGEATDYIEVLRQSLKTAMDGDAMPIWPVYKRIQATRPELAKTQNPNIIRKGVSLENSLLDEEGGGENWINIRERMVHIKTMVNAFNSAVSGSQNKWKAYKVATEDSPDANDPNSVMYDEPKSMHFGVFIGNESSVTGRTTNICGIVIDEWTDYRASKYQYTGMAINYDSPQNEAPQCILLGLPDSTSQTSWDTMQAANIVKETIGLMKIRALPSYGASFSAANFDWLSVLPAKKVGSEYNQRVPQRLFAFVFPPGVWREGAGFVKATTRDSIFTENLTKVMLNTQVLSISTNRSVRNR